MSKPKTYQCGICETKPDSISHHKSHIESQRHKDKKELYSLKIEKLSKDDLALEMGKYKAKTTVELVLKIESIVSPNNTEMEDEIIEASNIIIAKTAISNKEALKIRIHGIHNTIRNYGGGYGMAALKLFNILYGLMKIEEKGLLEKLGLTDDCKFSSLYKLAIDDKSNMSNEKLSDIILNKVITELCNGKLNHILYYEIPDVIKSKVFAYLIKEIYSLSDLEKSCNVQLSGKVYEYFVGRDDTAISEMGAYFSDRHLTTYTLEQVKPKIQTNGEIPTMIDMFGGSGGFTLEYINHMINQNDKIDWTKEISKIHHYDMNLDVVKSAALEAFCLTGEIPDKNNFQYKNSFTDEFNNEKYDYIFTNPPYGGDKIKKSYEKLEREKIKKHIEEELKICKDEQIILKRKRQLMRFKQEEKLEKTNSEKNKVSIDNCSRRIQDYSKINKLKGNDKESASLILIMNMLKKNGTAAAILKEGVFFTETYKNIRECLIKNFNVRKIISIPKDQFENTTTKTTIIIFDNTENKTEKIEFYDLIIEKYESDKFEEIDDNIVITEFEGDIKNVYDKLIIVATLDDLINNKEWSLHGKDYKEKTIKINNDYEMVNMVSLCEFLPKSKKSGTFGKEEGKYNYYTSSEKVQKCDEADYNEECLIIGTGGYANIKIDNNFSCSVSNFILKSPYCKYIYYILHGNKNLMSDLFKGSTQDNLSKEDLSKIEIPLPKDKSKIDNIVKVISEKQNKLKEIQNDISDYEENITEAIKEINDNYDCDVIELNKMCEYIKTGKNKTPDNKKGKLYPYYGTASITGYTDSYLFDGDHILVARNGSVGNCFIASGKIYPSDHIFVIKNNKNYHLLYIYYIVKSIKTDIVDGSNYSVIPGISKENLSKIKIKIPKDKDVIAELNVVFDEIQRLKQEEKIVELEYQELLKNMSKEIIISY